MRITLGLALWRLARAGTLRCGRYGVPLVWQVRGPHAAGRNARCACTNWYIGSQIPPRPWSFCLGIARKMLHVPQNCTRGPEKAHSAPTYIRRTLPACGGMCLLAIPNMHIPLVMCQTKGTPPGGALGENTNIPWSGTPPFSAH